LIGGLVILVIGAAADLLGWGIRSWLEPPRGTQRQDLLGEPLAGGGAGEAAYVRGWDIRSWLDHLWDTMSEISLGYLVAGVALKTLQTTATAFAWYGILRYAYPTTRFRLGVACYAA